MGEMTPAEVAAKLRHFNAWRRDFDDKFEQPDPREIVVAHHKSQRLARIAITPSFGSVAQRQARVQKPKPEVRSVYERVMDDDLFDEP